MGSDRGARNARRVQQGRSPPSGKARQREFSSKVFHTDPDHTWGQAIPTPHSPRSAEIRADDAVECAELPLEAIDAILTAGGNLPITLLRNLSLLLNTRVRDANAELSNYLP
jgi:hypothetical protein